MVGNKEELFRHYYEASIKALQSLDGERVDEVVDWLSQRDQIIEKINAIDQVQGSTPISESLRLLLEEIDSIDQQLVAKLSLRKDEAKDKLREIQMAKSAKQVYHDEYDSSEGIFYDKRR